MIGSLIHLAVVKLAVFFHLQMISSTIYIEAYKIGIEVPGQIKASFNRPRGGIAEDIKDEIIVEYSKYLSYNIRLFYL